MPDKVSYWVDIGICALAFLMMSALVFTFDTQMGIGCFVVLAALFIFAYERMKRREREYEKFCDDVVKNVSSVSYHVIETLPQAILVADADEKLRWANSVLEKFTGKKQEIGKPVADFWPGIMIKPVWGMTGETTFTTGDATYRAIYRPVAGDDEPKLMAFYVTDVTELAKLRDSYQASRVALAFIQIDNYDEVLQDLTEAERTTLIFAVTSMLDAWIKGIGGFIRKVSDELYIAVMERRSLDQALADKFEILDRVRTLKSTNKLPVTLSIGCALVANTQELGEVAMQTQKKLDLALGRGGDQAAVLVDGKTQFFGGKAQAVEKHTRVKARVVTHALSDIIDGADEVYVMGHKNEDFDSLGASMGIAKIARHLKKPVKIMLSELNEGIDKFTGLLADKADYNGLFIHEKNLDDMIIAQKSVLVIVDTHIPHMVASPKLLAAVPRVVVIDHHRRSEQSIENPLLVYIEPSSSSTSELVSELLMYVSDDLKLTRFDATALYAGIVVDTKHFGVQTGVRTLEAAAYLRRAGADPVMVRQLFREDYETNLTIAKAAAGSKLYEGGLIVASCPEPVPNIQAIAAQAADSMLTTEGVRMSIVVFQLNADTVGISARSVGELNVQVIMEEFGGGGHQNVAGAQLKGAKLTDTLEKAVSIAKKYIKENG